jgi:hypothetical protein
MSAPIEKPPKLGNEITVRISLTFQEAPDIHTLLAMTPVRERGKLVRAALTRYIVQTAHPAGDVEQQISAISTWLRSRMASDETAARFNSRPDMPPAVANEMAPAAILMSTPIEEFAAQVNGEAVLKSTSSINRWLHS